MNISTTKSAQGDGEASGVKADDIEDFSGAKLGDYTNVLKYDRPLYTGSNVADYVWTPPAFEIKDSAEKNPFLQALLEEEYSRINENAPFRYATVSAYMNSDGKRAHSKNRFELKSEYARVVFDIWMLNPSLSIPVEQWDAKAQIIAFHDKTPIETINLFDYMDEGPRSIELKRSLDKPINALELNLIHGEAHHKFKMTCYITRIVMTP
jgi:hypothetical protein